MRHHTYQSLRQARDFIRSQYHTPLTLEAIATQAHLSPYHFLRLFKQTFQETPHQYLTRLRLQQAKHQLTQDNDTILDICLNIGFTSPSSFSHLFTKHCGCSPSTYRETTQTLIAVPGQYPTVFIPYCYATMLFGGSKSATFDKPKPSNPTTVKPTSSSPD